MGGGGGIAFDMSGFYPFITEELLDKALDFASHYIGLTTDERMAIKHTKILLSIAITCHGAN